MSKAKNYNLAINDDIGTDILYNSLKRQHSPTVTPVRIVSLSPLTDKASKKELTCILNEIYFTNGKPSSKNENESEIQEKIGSKRILYKKSVRSIRATCNYKSCVYSDTVSIDIEPESTYLPLMCKLMIIVDGAAFERGTRVLVRDASVQVSFDEPKDIKKVPSIKIHSSDRHLSDSNYLNVHHHHHHHQTIRTHKHMSKCWSSERLNMDELNDLNNNSNIYQRGGSLSNLPRELPIYMETKTQTNKYNTNKNNLNKSYLNLREYLSTPYYQYQSKNLIKRDFSTYCTLSELEDEMNSRNSESIELYIPIKIDNNYHNSRNHRNEKYILINNKNYHDHDCFGSSIKSFRDNMRRYIDEKLNKFEAEITFFNANESKLSKFIQPKLITFKQQQPTDGRYYHSHSSYTERTTNNLNEPSVTNLVLMQVVDGRIIE